MKPIARLTSVIIVALTLAGFLVISAGALQEPVGWPTDRPILQQPTQVATTTYNVELVGQLVRGPTDVVAVQGHFAYINVGHRLVVLDVSDPVRPKWAAQSAVFPDGVEDIYVAGNYAYVASGDLVRVLDVSDPTAPTEMGAYDTPGWAQGVYVVDDYAYVAEATVIDDEQQIGGGLRVVDISDPTAPVQVGAHETPGTSALSVYVAGNYAYVCDNPSAKEGLRVIDISDPTAPVQVGYTSDGGRDVYVAGNYAYLAWSYQEQGFGGGYRGGLRVLDISDPTAPALVAAPVGETHPIRPPVYAVHVTDNYAYVAGRDLWVVDVSDPTQPVVVGEVGRFGTDIFIAGSHAYLVAKEDTPTTLLEDAGLRVIDVSNPADPVEVGAYDGPNFVETVFVAANYAYLASPREGLRIVDVSSPTLPVLVGTYDLPKVSPASNEIIRLDNIHVAGNYAYLAAQDAGLQVIDISDPTTPVEVGKFDPGFVVDVHIAGNYAYVIGVRKLWVLDVSDPTAPLVVSNTRAYGTNVHVAGNYAYVTSEGQYSPLQIVDVSDPTMPMEVGVYDEWRYAADIFVANGYAYVVGAGSLRIVDVSDPTAPVEVGSLRHVGYSEGIYVAGNYAYVAAGWDGGLRVVDVSIPAAPVEVGAHETPGPAKDVHAVGNYAYVAAGSAGGFVIYRLSPSTSVHISPTGGTLSSSFDQTTYTFASDTFTSTVMITHTTRTDDDVPSSGSLISMRHVFEVTASYSSTGQPAQPTRPYTVTVQYADVDKGTAIEDTLALYSWDGEQWVKETTSVVNTEANTVTATPTHFGLWAVLGMPHRAYLPIIAKQYETRSDQSLFPRPDLADKIWQAVERFVDEYPPADIYPGYASEAGGPSAENVAANVDAACHDFPDLPDPFGEGSHHAACYQWVSVRLGLYHTVSAWRGGSSEDIAWAQYYLDETLNHLTAFVYGPEDSPTGVGYRDTLAAIWQNPVRAMGVTILADLLRKQDALGAEREARVEELLSGIVRAWYAEFWETGQHPTTGVPFTTRTAPEVEAYSLEGKQVASTEPWTFEWDADKGNTPAEEVAWMGAGVMLATRALSNRLPDADDIYAAARHYTDFAIAYNRPDPIHGGTVRTLNAETEGGAYGQRRYWIENHASDVPSMPYMSSTWNFIDAALLASDLGNQQPWLSLVPDDAQWDVLLRSAGETMRAPDGTFLVDFTPGQGIGYNLDRFPAWWTPCGQPAGGLYVHYDGRAGGPSIYISEGGGAAGLDLLLTGWPLMRIAAYLGDVDSYRVWEDRLNRVLDEYRTHPPNLNWTVCKTAPYVSDNPGYHWALTLVLYSTPYLGTSGYEVEPWPP